MKPSKAAGIEVCGLATLNGKMVSVKNGPQTAFLGVADRACDHGSAPLLRLYEYVRVTVSPFLGGNCPLGPGAFSEDGLESPFGRGIGIHKIHLHCKWDRGPLTPFPPEQGLRIN